MVFLIADQIEILILGPHILLVDPQQYGHTHKCGEQHVRFSQRIKRPVIQDNAGNDIDRAGLLQPVLHISADHVQPFRVLHSITGQKGDRKKQHADQKRAADHSDGCIEDPESVVFDLNKILCPLYSADIIFVVPFFCFDFFTCTVVNLCACHHVLEKVAFFSCAQVFVQFHVK